VLYPAKGEPIVRHETRGTWEYVYDTDDGHHKYLHRECDAVEEDGYCVMCGAACPTIWTAQYGRPMDWPHTA
jgi:hypothetical protein